MKPAIGDQRHNISTAKADIGVGVEHRVGYQTGRVIVWISGLRCEVFGENGVIRRQRKSDDFIDADACAGHGAVNTVNKSSGVADVGRIEHGSLLNGTAQLAAAGDFKSVSYAATEFLLRPSATGGEQRSERNYSEKGKCVTHKF